MDFDFGFAPYGGHYDTPRLNWLCSVEKAWKRAISSSTTSGATLSLSAPLCRSAALNSASSSSVRPVSLYWTRSQAQA